MSLISPKLCLFFAFHGIWWTSHCLHDLVLLHTQPTVSQAQIEGSTLPAYPLLGIQLTENIPWALLSHQSYWDSVLTDKLTVEYIFLYFCLTSQIQCKGLNFLSNKLERTTLFTRSSYSQIPITQLTLPQAQASHPLRSAISLFFSCSMRLWCMRWKSRSFLVFRSSSLALLKNTTNTNRQDSCYLFPKRVLSVQFRFNNE